MLLTRLDHVQIAMPPGAPAEQQARAFYAGLLALPEIPKPPILAARGGIWFQGAGFQLHLGVEPDFRPAKKAHPAFRTGDVDQLARVLQGAGVAVTWDDAIPGQRRFYAGDPFGNRLEFMAD
jgi:catechol 2,3-dioxygenase-like lactoylglutathione lyase family enzyme